MNSSLAHVPDTNGTHSIPSYSRQSSFGSSHQPASSKRGSPEQPDAAVDQQSASLPTALHKLPSRKISDLPATTTADHDVHSQASTRQHSRAVCESGNSLDAPVSLSRLSDAFIIDIAPSETSRRSVTRSRPVSASGTEVPSSATSRRSSVDLTNMPDANSDMANAHIALQGQPRSSSADVHVLSRPSSGASRAQQLVHSVSFNQEHLDRSVRSSSNGRASADRAGSPGRSTTDGGSMAEHEELQRSSSRGRVEAALAARAGSGDQSSYDGIRTIAHLDKSLAASAAPSRHISAQVSMKSNLDLSQLSRQTSRESTASQQQLSTQLSMRSNSMSRQPSREVKSMSRQASNNADGRQASADSLQTVSLSREASKLLTGGYDAEKLERVLRASTSGGGMPRAAAATTATTAISATTATNQAPARAAGNGSMLGFLSDAAGNNQEQMPSHRRWASEGGSNQPGAGDPGKVKSPAKEHSRDRYASISGSSKPALSRGGRPGGERRLPQSVSFREPLAKHSPPFRSHTARNLAEQRVADILSSSDSDVE